MEVAYLAAHTALHSLEGETLLANGGPPGPRRLVFKANQRLRRTNLYTPATGRAATVRKAHFGKRTITFEKDTFWAGGDAGIAASAKGHKLRFVQRPRRPRSCWLQLSRRETSQESASLRIHICIYRDGGAGRLVQFDLTVNPVITPGPVRRSMIPVAGSSHSPLMILAVANCGWQFKPKNAEN